MNSFWKLSSTLAKSLIVAMASLPLVAWPDVQVAPPSAPPGSPLHVYGHVQAGSQGVRLLWQQGDQARGYIEGPVEADGAFDLSVSVPASASTGPATLYSLPTKTLDGLIESASFQVKPTPAGTVTGTVSVPSPGSMPPFQPPPAGTKVCLKDAYGQIVDCTTTDPTGSWTITAPPGTYTVSTETTGIDEPPVTVNPGTTNSVSVKPLPGTTEPICDAKFFLHYFVANSVGIGALINQPEIALGRQDYKPFARFISFGTFSKADGVPDVSIQFTAEFEATCSMKVGTVIFTLRDSGGNVLFEQLTGPEKAAQDIDRRSVTLNVSHLPAGTHAMELQIFPGDPNFAGLTANWKYPVEVVDLSSRWFSGNANKDANQALISVTALPDEHALKYSLHAVVPKNAIQLSGGDFSLGPLSLQNHALIGVKLDEHYDSERHYGGSAHGDIDVALLKLTAFNQTLNSIVDKKETYPFNGPKSAGGSGFFNTGYETPETSLGSALEEIPIFGIGKQKCIKFCFVGCKKCVGFKVGLFAKVQGGADFGMKVTPDLGVRALIAPCVKAALPLIFQLDVIICSAGARAEAAASMRLPLRFDFSNNLGFHFDQPNVRLQSTLKYYARCFGITFFRGSKTLANWQWGPGPIGDSCADDFGLQPSSLVGSHTVRAMSDEPPLTPDEEAGPVKPDEIPPLLQPAVSINGACQNLTVWIGGPQEGPDADGHLRFSFTDSDGSSIPANVDPAGALAESPTVAWLDNTHALAVWVQSTSPLADLAMEAEPTVPATLELAYAVWDTTTMTWTAPQFLTNDDRWDLRPVLTANQSTGEALVVWLRQHEIDPSGPEPIEPRGLYYAQYQNGIWTTPAPLLNTTSDFYHQPAIRYDRSGTPHAVIVADADGNPETANDRSLKLLQLGLGGWSIIEDIPTPLGAFNPSLDFDTSNAPVVAYLAPPTDPETQLPTGGDGNGSTLGLAHKFGGVWRNAESASAGERPTLRVDPSNRAFVLLRRFGHGESGGIHDTGDRGVSQADLAAPSLKLINTYTTDDGHLHWEPAFDMDPATGCAVFSESAGDPSGTSVSIQQGILQRGPDLCLVPGSFNSTDPHPVIGETITIEFRLTNKGLDTAVGGFKIKLYEGAALPQKTPFLVQSFPRDFPPGFEVTISTEYTNQLAGRHSITAVVDEENQIIETDKSNNVGYLLLGEVPAVCKLRGSPVDDGGGIQLDWQAPAFTTDSAPFFFLQRRTLPSEPWEILGFGTQPSFIDPLAKLGISYEYRVIVRDSAGVFSPPCATTISQLDGRPVSIDRPNLSLLYDGGRSSILSWPATATGFQVETTDNLETTPVVWVPSSITPVLSGEHFEVTITTIDSQRFYRLVHH